MLGWCQSRVSRRMKLRFPHDGMNDYKRVFREGRGRGFVKQLEDGSSVVDGIVEDDTKDD